MDREVYIFCLIGIAVQACVLYLVVAAATRAKTRTNIEWASMKLLEKIALKQGVPAEEINELLNKI
jgi:hypothetical protein